MSVLIRGMEMPHDCEECKLCVIIPVGDYQILRKCVALNRRAEYVIRRKDCPLVELPPHGRLIDADALNYTMLYKENWMSGTGVEAPAVWKKDIDNAPAVIEAEEADQ